MIIAPQTNLVSAEDHLRPSTLTEAQDQLLLAGSKLSFTDVYNKEMSIPLVKGKFYRASDVDDTFIILNGILADVSEQAFAKNKQLLTLHEEVANLRAQVMEAEGFKSQVSELQERLSKREEDLKTFVLVSKAKIDSQGDQIAALENENNSMSDMIRNLVDRIHELERK